MPLEKFTKFSTKYSLPAFNPFSSKFIRLLTLSLLLIALTPAVSQTITGDLSSSRVSGVAPLTVFFDATGTTHSDSTVRPLLDLHYAWDFGDALAGDWELSDSSKNKAIGGNVGHLFDQPGSYTVTLTITDEWSTTDVLTTSITVSDPDSVFSDSNTVCFSTTGTFTGAPTGAQLVTIAGTSLTEIQPYVESGKRLLFMRGDTIKSSSSLFIKKSGPGMIGAFGAGVSPDAKGIYSNNPVIEATGGANLFMLGDRDTSKTARDWRFQDLNLVNSGASYCNAFYTLGGADEITFYRLKGSEFYVHILFNLFILDHWINNGGPGHHLFDGMAIVDSKFSGPLQTSNTVFVSGARMMIMGCDLTSVKSHVLRIPFAQKAYINHNRVLYPAANRHALKLHAPDWSGSGLGYNQFSESVVISENVFEGDDGVDWIVTIWPEDNSSDQRLRDVVFERNLIRAGNDIETQIAAVSGATNSVMRNNIADATNGFRYFLGFGIMKRGIEPAPDSSAAYNNTIYRDDEVREMTGVTVGASVTNSFVHNNLLYAPNAVNASILVRDLGTGTDKDNNLEPTINPFISSNPSAAADFQLNDSSAAIDVGTIDVVLDDYTGTLRSDSLTDVGAFEYVASSSKRGSGKPAELQSENTPEEFFLGANYPNPFNPQTQIAIRIPEAGHVKLEIFDISGRLVRQLLNASIQSGEYTLTWNGQSDNSRQVSSGVYIYKMEAKGFVQTKKMMLIR